MIANHLRQARREAEEVRLEKEELDSRVRAEVSEEISALRSERDEFERQLEGTSMAREDVASAACGLSNEMEVVAIERATLADRLEKLERDMVNLVPMRLCTPTDNKILITLIPTGLQRQLVAEGNSEKRESERVAKELDKAKREQGELLQRLADVTRDKKDWESRYEEAMLEMERQASVLLDLQTERSDVDEKLKRLQIDAQIARQVLEGS